MNSKVSTQLTNFLSFFRTIEKECKNAQVQLSNMDDRTQDLLHQIELGSSKDRNRYATELSKVRKQRRFYKDFIIVREKLADFLTTKEAVTVIRRLEQILGDIRKQEVYVDQHRTYNPKVYKNLSINLTEENKDE